MNQLNPAAQEEALLVYSALDNFCKEQANTL
jgi:hypothetical protein